MEIIHHYGKFSPIHKAQANKWTIANKLIKNSGIQQLFKKLNENL